MRTPNTKCTTCAKPIYRRPNELKRLTNAYCSRKCQGAIRTTATVTGECGNCAATIVYKAYAKRNYCSRACSNIARRGITYTKGGLPNKAAVRLVNLLKASGTDTCMFAGCNYTRCLDIHRLVEGKNGGCYVKDNMFAICPNHHAEIHRGIIKVEQVSEFSLRVVDYIAETQLSKYHL